MTRKDRRYILIGINVAAIVIVAGLIAFALLFRSSDRCYATSRVEQTVSTCQAYNPQTCILLPRH